MTRGAAKNIKTPTQLKTIKKSRLTSKEGMMGDTVDTSGWSEESRSVFEMLSDKLDKMMERMDMKEKRIEQLESDNALLRTKLMRVEDRLDEIECLGRRNNFLISGSSLPPALVGESTGQVTAELLKNALHYELPQTQIVRAYRVGSKPKTQGPDTRNIMVHLRDHDRKTDILNACRTVKPSNLYVSDDLIPVRSNIQYALRQLKKKRTERIAYCGSIEGRVYIWLKPPNVSAPNQKVFINTIDGYRKLCTEELNVDPDEFFRK